MNTNEWWRGAVIYQIYPRSYADSNNNGVGDLRGIIDKLDYVASLKVDAIWLSPFFKSPMKDYGYDVSNYRDVDPLFGSLDDFKKLVDKAHGLGIKIIIDQVLSHSSDQHQWFIQSRKDKTNPKHDWYVWADPKSDGTVPNNWLSVFGGSAWSWDSRRAQYYLHNFLESQPDLNFHNPDVQQQVLDDVEFWLKLGVDGIRLDACNFYFHDQQLRNNPPVPIDAEQTKGVTGANPYSMQRHVYDICRPENLPFQQRLRQLFNRYPGSCSLGEIGADNALEVMAEYTEGGDKLFMAYTFDLLTTDYDSSDIRKVVGEVESTLTDGWPCWSFCNHDVPRAISRLTTDAAKTPAQANMLLALLTSLRGSSCVYQGEELMLPEADIPFERIQDPYGIPFWPEFKGRDGCRTPMPWQADKTQAGFSEVEPWLPMPVEHLPLARDLQEKSSTSALNLWRHFLTWRKQQPALIHGNFSWLNHKDEQQTLLFSRKSDQQHLLVAVNISADEKTITVPTAYADINILASSGFECSYNADEQQLTLPAWQLCFAQIKTN